MNVVRVSRRGVPKGGVTVSRRGVPMYDAIPLLPPAFRGLGFIDRRYCKTWDSSKFKSKCPGELVGDNECNILSTLGLSVIEAMNLKGREVIYQCHVTRTKLVSRWLTAGDIAR